jgi:hypothetical protein
MHHPETLAGPQHVKCLKKLWEVNLQQSEDTREEQRSRTCIQKKRLIDALEETSSEELELPCSNHTITQNQEI